MHVNVLYVLQVCTYAHTHTQAKTHTQVYTQCAVPQAVYLATSPVVVCARETRLGLESPWTDMCVNAARDAATNPAANTSNFCGELCAGRTRLPKYSRSYRSPCVALVCSNHRP